MATINELRQDMEFMNDFSNIIEVFKSTALMQLRSFQEKKVLNSEYTNELEDFRSLIAKQGYTPVKYSESKSSRTLVIVITSDGGFVGDLNSYIINTALKKYNVNSNQYMVLGLKGSDFLESRSINHLKYPGIDDVCDYLSTEKIVDDIVAKLGDEYYAVSVFYPKFQSLAVQKISEAKLYPLLESEYSENTINRNIELDSNGDAFYDNFLTLYLKKELYEIFYSSKLSEFAARIMHLENSGIELGNLNKSVAHKYFKEVHAKNDKSIREISASKLLIGDKDE